ncbi:zinc finger protein CONSTANS-LIKE 4-like [Wolffia australiana]
MYAEARIAPLSPFLHGGLLLEDFVGDGGLFAAPELGSEELDFAAFSIADEALKISDVGCISDDQFLGDVFGDCGDFLAETRVEDAFPELAQPSIDLGSVIDGEATAEMMREGVQPKVEEGSMKMEDGGDGPLQKSVSSGCLTSMDWIHGGGDGQMKHGFLGIPGMDLGAVFGMRRAYSEGDIQTLVTHLNVGLVHPPLDRLIPLKMEDRMQKLSRYRRKKTKRNFDRKIKYACRKALADSQPRIRGRFAKTEEGEAGKAT